jgi:hypothetical protein
MNKQEPQDFRHTTLKVRPDSYQGITLLDECPGFTGIYLRDANGGLWPARTVSRENEAHHTSVCEGWLLRKGIHEDKRTQSPPIPEILNKNKWWRDPVNLHYLKQWAAKHSIPSMDILYLAKIYGMPDFKRYYGFFTHA